MRFLLFVCWPLAGLASTIDQRQSSQKITLNVNQNYQTIDGFGISEAFQRANNIVNLNEPKQSQVLDLLFNTSSGAGFSIVRNGIGSSPSNANDWMITFAQDPGSPSSPPKYNWDGKDSGQLWFSQQAAQRYGVKTFYGNAWSSPGFMKTNKNDANGGAVCGLPGATCSSGDWRQAYADYLVQYVKYYAAAGVSVTHLGFVNEPDISTSYASMQISGAQAADFIKVLYPTLAQNNMSHVVITCCEATGWNMQSQYTQQLKAAGVEAMVGAITGHTYTSGISGAQSTTRKVWETECSDLNGGWSTAWYSNGGGGDGYTWANNIYTGLTTGNVSAYLWWVGTQDRSTNNNNNEKLILVDGQNYQVSKRLWAFAQYSRTVRPGAVRVGISGGSGLKLTAFFNVDGKVAVNVINTAASTASLSISGFNGTTVQAWISDNTHDMETITASISGGTVTGSVPGRGMVSFVVS
ncbi:glycoside hydrolase family 30 protein [Truncatella angustata]|uniref:Glycoside hydrolase family 30 protein n=1 Tax=Truncatella angustata TaxID=152316 RepID=A0A9P8UQ85_9PEZI|nr:glycoside hydrolase family 30 protein [Truncatella angustata]KAH6656321.1 glycoside hydrolase family 30 protein [Truncatella angustata]